MPSRTRRALVDQQNRDATTGRWLPGKKTGAGNKPGAGKSAAEKPSMVKKAASSPSPTSSNEAAAIETGKDSAKDEMRYMSLWDIHKEVGVSLQKIKEFERLIAKEKARKNKIAETLEMIVGVKVKLAEQKGRKNQFQKKVVKVSNKAAPDFWELKKARKEKLAES